MISLGRDIIPFRVFLSFDQAFGGRKKALIGESDLSDSHGRLVRGKFN